MGRSSGSQRISHEVLVISDGYCAYRSTSMTPIFQEGDVLEVVPCHTSTPQIGDVVVFTSSEEDMTIVHRIVRESAEGFITRGDNSPADDLFPVQLGQIKGVVRYRWRMGERKKVAGGWMGLLLARMRWMLRPARLGLYRLLGPLYRFISGWGIVRKILPKRLRPRVVSFSSERGEFKKIMLGSRVIGNFDAQRGQWQIRRPFKLFIPEEILTRHSSPHLQTIGKDQAC